MKGFVGIIALAIFVLIVAAASDVADIVAQLSAL